MADDAAAKAYDLTLGFIGGGMTAETYTGLLKANPKLKEAVNKVVGKLQSAANKAMNQLPVTVTAGVIPDLSMLL
jgi:CRISPR/Cas system CSM-associated protein Csm5 (group 7 of RAMP superfamily)